MLDANNVEIRYSLRAMT